MKSVVSTSFLYLHIQPQIEISFRASVRLTE